MGLTSFKMLQANMSNSQIFTSSYGSLWYGLDVFWYWYSDVSKQHIPISRGSFRPVGKGISATSDYTAPNRSAEECRLVGERHPPEKRGEKRGSKILRFWQSFRVLKGRAKGPIYPIYYILYVKECNRCMYNILLYMIYIYTYMHEKHVYILYIKECNRYIPK